MKRNGFTLIELLAVIVILAIIALIATPIVLNIINNAKTSSNERSGELYIKAVENAIMKKQMNGTDVVTSGDYTVQSDGSICIVSNNVCESGTTISVDVDGDVPESGTLTVSNGVVVSYNLVVSGTSVTKGESSGNGSTTTKVYTNGEAVYFNVTTGVKCTEVEAVSETGTKAGCMKFYAFNDEGESSNTINLILDHNTTATVAWVNKEDFIAAGGTESDWAPAGTILDSISENKVIKGPVTALKQLKSDTENWNGVDIRDDYYTNAHYGYTVNYSGYRARLITTQEIAQIVGNTTWDEETATDDDWYFFDSKDQDLSKVYKEQGTSDYAWLFDYTGDDDEGDCTQFGCNIGDTSTMGYWTVSTSTSRSAFFVQATGRIWDEVVTLMEAYGIRPVITVLKSKLN